MVGVAIQDVDVMRTAVFFDDIDARRKTSRFWILLVLAAIIASAGVVADSTATVIGAMIVAPLMTPIQGTMLAVILADRANLVRSMALVAAGAATAIGIGYLVALLVVNDVVAANNSQVAGRVSPGLIDLLAALATGVVASVALVRRDIADTLPGVAIAISLVPPLAVVGITLEAGEAGQAVGALLLFVTNVAAILATGTIVMAIFGAHRVSAGAPGVNRRNAAIVIAAMVVIVGVPLTASSVTAIAATNRQTAVRDAGREWAASVGWELVDVDEGDDRTIARFEGPVPVPDTETLLAVLRAHGVKPSDVRAELLPRETVDLQD